MQGADLDDADLQGASLIEAQLQSASLSRAKVEGTLLRKIFVWRTDPPSHATGASVEAPEPGPKYFSPSLDCHICDWSETSYATLKLLVQNSLSEVRNRDEALWRIRRLEEQPYVADESSAKAWANLSKQTAHSAHSHFSDLAKLLQEIGCAASGAPYVIEGLIRQQNLDHRFEGNLLHMAQVATSFLDEATCPGARGLSDENRATLQEIRIKGLPALSGLGAPVRKSWRVREPIRLPLKARPRHTF